LKVLASSNGLVATSCSSVTRPSAHLLAADVC
jgi:hypothetical protein